MLFLLVEFHQEKSDPGGAGFGITPGRG